MNEPGKPAAELEAEIELKRNFLRTALVVAGSMKSSPAATRVSSNEAAALKSEIAGLEEQLEAAQKAA